MADALYIPATGNVGSADINAKIQSRLDKLARDWTNLPAGHNLTKFAAALPQIVEKAQWNEMYGVELVVPEGEGKPIAHTTLIILQKFLRANADDLAQAQAQLLSALEWRKEYQPLKVRSEVFSSEKFGGLGFVTRVAGAKESPNEEDIVTFNIYGVAAKQSKQTFGDTDAFVRWRVALQEIAIEQLNLNEATQNIPDYGKGPDPYKAINVHDYLSVSFFRQPAEIKASSSKIIDMFQKYYPETVSYKYFVNVPLVMQWMMGAMKMMISKDSFQTMTWMTYGSELHKYLGKDVGKDYGGDGLPLREVGVTTNFDTDAKVAPRTTATPAVTVTAASPATPAEPSIARSDPAPYVDTTETGESTTAGASE